MHFFIQCAPAEVFTEMVKRKWIEDIDFITVAPAEK